MEGDKECGQRSGSSRGEEKTQKGANCEVQGEEGKSTKTSRN